MKFLNYDNLFEHYNKESKKIDDNIGNKIKCYNKTISTDYKTFIIEQFKFIINDNLNSFIKNSLGLNEKNINVLVL